MERLSSSQALTDYRETLQQPAAGPLVIVGTGTCGEAQGCRGVIDAFNAAIQEQGAVDKVTLREAGCLGFCEIEPIVIVRNNGPPGILYQ